MRHTPLAVEIWGAFLILAGVGLLVFNRRWAAWATPLTPLNFIPMAPWAKTVVGRAMTMVVGAMMLAAGASAYLPIGPGPH